MKKCKGLLLASARPDIIVHKTNEATAFVECSSSIHRELTSYFSVFADNYRFNPKFKAKMWDGKLRFFDYQNHLPIGLVGHLRDFASKGGYTYHCKFKSGEKIDFHVFKAFVDDLHIIDDEGNPMEPRDYQLLAAYESLCDGHLNVSSSTASGKSLILYLIVKWLRKHDEKVICIVPSVQLVEQLYSDFLSYGWFNVEEECCRIYAGQKRMIEKGVIISTWQSLYKDKKEFAKFDAILIDEAHGAKAKSITEIMHHSINARYRIGVSGSYPEPATPDWFGIVGGMGPIKVYSTYKSLQDAGYISQIQITVIQLKYPPHIKTKNFKENSAEYSQEQDYVNRFKERITFIRKMSQKLSGNTLILFTKKEAHGYPLHEQLKAELVGKNVLYIDGDTPPKEREYLRQYMETHDNCVLIATYGTLSTGVNIKRIHNIIFASGYKSRVKVIQSIGRGLRKYKDKVFLKLYDIVDDLSFIDKRQKIKYINYSIQHFKERLKIYNKEQFAVKYIQYELTITGDK
jgi:superfamily II DNA or RNA helicase